MQEKLKHAALQLLSRDSTQALASSASAMAPLAPEWRTVLARLARHGQGRVLVCTQPAASVATPAVHGFPPNHLLHQCL